MPRRNLLFCTLAAGVALLAGGAYSRCLLANRGADVRLAADPEPPKEPAWRAAKEAERKAAIASIEAQLKAFKADDYGKAEKYQSSELRQNFRNPDDFRRMMRESYPEFANYKSAVFGEARCNETGELLEIPITLTGQNRVVVKATYMMIREDGGYRVLGVSGGLRKKVDLRNVI